LGFSPAPAPPTQALSPPIHATVAANSSPGRPDLLTPGKNSSVLAPLSHKSVDTKIGRSLEL